MSSSTCLFTIAASRRPSQCIAKSGGKLPFAPIKDSSQSIQVGEGVKKKKLNFFYTYSLFGFFPYFSINHINIFLQFFTSTENHIKIFCVKFYFYYISSIIYFQIFILHFSYENSSFLLKSWISHFYFSSFI